MSVAGRKMILAADIGGTKTNIALFDPGDLLRPARVSVFASGEMSGPAEIVRQFLAAGARPNIVAAGFGVAGPVHNGRARITKLPWDVDGSALARMLSAPVVLVNDLVATAAGVDAVPPESLVVLQKGDEHPSGPRAVLAPGTGLGEAYMLFEHGRYRAWPSEGGHVPFAPVDDEQTALAAFARARHAHVSYDLLCSGRGLALIYDFMRREGGRPCNGEVAAKAAAAEDPAPVVGRAGVAGECPCCVAALALFARILAAEAGNLAVKFLATGGVFIGGGITAKILPAMQTAQWRRAFAGNGPMAGFLARVPVTAVTEPRAALVGAAVLAAEGIR